MAGPSREGKSRLAQQARGETADSPPREGARAGGRPRTAGPWTVCQRLGGGGGGKGRGSLSRDHRLPSPLTVHFQGVNGGGGGASKAVRRNGTKGRLWEGCEAGGQRLHWRLGPPTLPAGSPAPPAEGRSWRLECGPGQGASVPLSHVPTARVRSCLHPARKVVPEQGDRVLPLAVSLQPSGPLGPVFAEVTVVC